LAGSAATSDQGDLQQEPPNIPLPGPVGHIGWDDVSEDEAYQSDDSGCVINDVTYIDAPQESSDEEEEEEDDSDPDFDPRTFYKFKWT
jgi:hypothetical protein